MNVSLYSLLPDTLDAQRAKELRDAQSDVRSRSPEQYHPKWDVTFWLLLLYPAGEIQRGEQEAGVSGSVSPAAWNHGDAARQGGVAAAESGEES